MLSLAAQLCRARKEKGWTIQRLLDESGVDIDRTGLQRKLREEQTLTTRECEALASALGITLTYPTRLRRRAA